MTATPPPDRDAEGTLPPEPPRRLGRRELERRRMLLRSIGAGSVLVGLALVGYFPVLKQLFDRLRPPGALEEDEFLAACIKCGQCVQVCPVEAIKLADGDEGYGLGTPYIDARAQACDFSCDAVQCVLSCPTGALTHAISTKEEVTMGVARLSRPDACLAMKGQGLKGLARGDLFEGLHRYTDIDRWNPIRIADKPYDLEICDLCVRECPIKGAISLHPVSTDPNDKRRMPVIADSCVGCGTCEMMCPVEPAAIVIEPKIMSERRA
ncbi:MAG: 4Fe-4S dicluster domain-containing protein [Phyllobacteriaceae bacterium]|jgi:ferredoxin-type protein NapG|nr:4Fe-4S dicluster domain-containing protein [Phyllobacteriaceae bacterium]